MKRLVSSLATASAIFVGGSLVFSNPALGQDTRPSATQPRTGGFSQARGPRTGSLLNRDDEYFKSDDGKRLVDNILSWQNENGGWYKNYSIGAPRPAVLPDDPNSGPPGDDDSVWHKVSTIDNNASTTELYVIGHAYRVTPDPKLKAAFDRGLKWLFDAQYPNGGWPQRFPLQDNYGRHITYNDNAMLHVMQMMHDVWTSQPNVALASDEQRKRAHEAFDKGIDCILRSQYKQDGKLTVWGQQVDEVTLARAGARTYELPSLCGSESDDLVIFLMSLPNPDQRVKDAVEGAVEWFEKSKLVGKRLARGADGLPSLVDDPNAPPLWGRFYDLKTNKPFVSGRNGIAKEKLEDIEPERRRGYSWFGNYGSSALERYKEWNAAQEKKS